MFYFKRKYACARKDYSSAKQTADKISSEPPSHGNKLRYRGEDPEGNK
ncbi:MAG TPA: hypothetical protein VK638_21100 [Edaphobacter sp.]|nr:hypothetical protein [Edaphobacter sp.]